MKAVILAGGSGSWVADEGGFRPKPMVEIGGQPILWHLMKLYASHGVREFIICCGYKGYLIKQYFANYFLYTADVTFDVANNRMTVQEPHAEPWRVTVVDTGEQTQTGGRLRRVRKYLGDAPFFFSYGDVLGDVDLRGLAAFHQQHQRLATVTTVNPGSRLGAIELDEDVVSEFRDKLSSENGWISGGFFVLSPQVLELIDGDATAWEGAPMQALVRQTQLAAFRHHGFWRALDTARDKAYLEELWHCGQAPWKTW